MKHKESRLDHLISNILAPVTVIGIGQAISASGYLPKNCTNMIIFLWLHVILLLSMFFIISNNFT